MKQRAMDVKLVVRPIMGWLTHSHFWEGPCRAGRAEDLTPEAETRAADGAFAAAKKQLKGVTDEIEFLAPIDARYDENLWWARMCSRRSSRTWRRWTFSCA